MIDLRTFIALLYLELVGPFLYPNSAHFLMHSCVELMFCPFESSKIRLGLAPFYNATNEVSKSYCCRLKNRV